MPRRTLCYIAPRCTQRVSIVSATLPTPSPIHNPARRLRRGTLVFAAYVAVLVAAFATGRGWLDELAAFMVTSLVLWPGTARARFLPAIPPGLDQAAFQARLIGDIEAPSTELALEAWNDGLSRPIPPELRARFEALRGARDA